MRQTLNLINGCFAAAALHNRGKARAAAAILLAWSAKNRFANFASGRWKPESETADIAISLTSWAPRLATLPLVLTGLLAQTLRPRAIFIWLTSDDLGRIAPSTRRMFEKCGVCFRECPDFGSHKKWLPLVAEGVTEPFVICDDDVFYPSGWLEGLLREDRGDAYVGTRCHRMRFGDNGTVDRYEAWDKVVAWRENPAHDLFVTGVGGAIVHPQRISDKYRDWANIREHCPQADDIWLKAAHLEAGVPCYRTKFTFPCLEVPSTQSSSLLQSNVDRGGNDRKMGSLNAAFGVLKGFQVL